MKTLLKTIVLLCLVILIAGCTIELKATDLEAIGSVSGLYEIDNVGWTERGPLWP